MAVVKVVKNSTRIFFGGQGSLIPMRRSTPRPSKKNTESTGSNSSSEIPSEWVEQIGQEAREQFGAPPAGADKPKKPRS